ncbi:aldose epimerase family protein [Flaviflagellibacter deserti]|jgi:aldose 1-epimerase|uniref:Aldose 1-epimerase n=1 Tax=Flaviflagellibacter deserti TaxID=2267266 RepID=A0ABV9Z545_9HYPH
MNAPVLQMTDRQPALERDVFGRLPGGRVVEILRLYGEDGFQARVITYGAGLQTLLVPDTEGRLADVVLGHDSAAGYYRDRSFFGATIGRFAGRIAHGRFAIDGQVHALICNDRSHALHGGDEGFDRQIWSVEALGSQPEPFVTLSRISPDGEEGYPGTLDVRVTYRVSGPRELTVEYSATTARPTVINLTHHSFFNLAGEASGDVLNHRLTLHADQYLPVDAGTIPLGPPAPVDGTPFDFRSPRPVGERIREDHEQLLLGRGYDHTFRLRTTQPGVVRLAARLEDPVSGRALDLLTDQPGLQLYSGNYLDGTARGKGGRLHRQSDALCLEPQGFPNAPNRQDYPSCRLDPGDVYSHRSIYRFSAA